MGPIQTCDTYFVEVDAQLVRSCGTTVGANMNVVTRSKRAKDARSEAFDVILGNHMHYCTGCENNNEHCRATRQHWIWEFNTRSFPSSPSRTKWICPIHPIVTSQLFPVKIGLKNVKTITKLSFVAEEPRDYWAERGYSCYDGI
jgi:predicted molibdopterin-dependent oxidoreductase YjgC